LDKREILAVKALIDNPAKVAIVIHFSPDGDAVGSAMAMAMYLQKKGHQVEVLSPNPFPKFLEWIPQSDTISLATRDLEICQEKLMTADFIFCMDFNAYERAGLLQDSLATCKQPKILIDHHIDPHPVFDYVYSEPENTSSTSELTYIFIAEMLGDKALMDKKIAECLYVGIMTDTGSLSYACNYDSTYRILQELMNYRIDGEKIHQLVYQTYTESRIRLLGYCLTVRLTVLEEYATSFIYLTQEDLDRFGYKHGDVDGIVNYGLAMEKVRFSSLLYQKEDRIRMSFRSKGNFDTNEFARKYFNGGGHKNASGGNFYQSMDEAITAFIEAVKESKNQLTQLWD
jgi:phosphoesterase RecJ-like protein